MHLYHLKTTIKLHLVYCRLMTKADCQRRCDIIIPTIYIVITGKSFSLALSIKRQVQQVYQAPGVTPKVSIMKIVSAETDWALTRPFAAWLHCRPPENYLAPSKATRSKANHNHIASFHKRALFFRVSHFTSSANRPSGKENRILMKTIIKMYEKNLISRANSFTYARP